MKVLKVFLITLIAFLLSGCYTQLQYSQKMKKVTDEPEGKVYSWDDEQETEQVEDPAAREEYEENIPLYYKDYEYEKQYEDCACNPYNVYNFYGHDRYGYEPYFSYGTYLSLSPSFFYRRHHPYYYGYRYHPRFSLSFSWGWGSPYYYDYYDPFFDPFYDYYRYGYRPYASRYGYFYRNYGGYYYGNKDRIDRNSRYGPRSIGTNRVVTNGNRTRNGNAVTGRSGTTVTSKPKARTRSVGTTRTRSSSDRTSSTVTKRSRSSSKKGSGTTRTRSRDNLQSNNDRYPIYIDRTDAPQRSVIINNRVRDERSRIDDNLGISEEYLRNSLQNPGIELNNRTVRSRSTFFERMKSFFKESGSRIINTDRIRTNTSTIRSRSNSSPPSRSTVRKSSSTSRSSSVSRNRSSSSSSRSSGSTSRSRSSSGGSSGSERSRDN